MANVITGSRIVFSVCILVSEPFSVPFWLFYILSGISDAADGFVARKTDTVSDFGAKLDSIADTVFLAVWLVKLYPFLKLNVPVWTWIGVIAAIKMASIVFGFVRRKELVMPHTKANKLTGILVFLLPFTIRFIDAKYSVAAVCAVASFAAVQELTLVLSGKTEI